ncbi:MAG: polysaccharide deacetylase family protein [endosymbiont of Galathealinum brachiosum]|uniref:Polysaccharide deacetylase family protein n=1 Tax=endosymbiont of Galathealinum brachiosum TaxID=2200906 RepID=A0A370DFV0_9GAMM|nr:MAG: polysaccharide deacetylase family protein [endosymbiont of Galathealinum brachiosum]
MNSQITNAFTVDVEDYFQVEALSGVVNRSDWGKHKCRVEKNTHKILSLLDESNQKGTFFTLGWIAERYPNLVKEIAGLGHEVASHGMSHKLIYTQTEAEFREETFKAKAIVEDIIQCEVKGYRAATYSITKKSLWALDVLVEAGFKYDSSIFPMRHDRYGIPSADHLPGIITTPNGGDIIEFPISTVKNSLFTMPIAGGGYFRLFNYFITKWGLASINRNNNPFMFYIHPWEVDFEQPRVDGLSRFSKFRHYNNLEVCERRLQSLLSDFKFDSMNAVLDSMTLSRTKY